MNQTQMARVWLLCLSFFLCAFTAACSSLSESEQVALLQQLRSTEPTKFSAALAQIVANDASEFVGPLIDLLWADQVGYLLGGDSAEIGTALRSISGQELEDSWEIWLNWYATTNHLPPSGYFPWKRDLFNELSSEFSAFFLEPVDPALRLEEIAWGGVAKDGIPSLNYLQQLPIAEAKGYSPSDAVFGISINGDHRAYPLRIMDWHEMANDVVGGVPLALTYCTLCGSAIVYKTDLANLDETLEFGSSGLLYRSNKLMYDRQTNTIWNQLTGKPVMGPLVGQIEQLELLPIVITTVAAWAEQHPTATILPLETGHFRDYTPGTAYGEYFVRDELLFPVGEIDQRLDAKEQVFALEIDGSAKAYPLTVFAEQPIINDTVGETDVVLIAENTRLNVYGYSYELEHITYSAGNEIRVFASDGFTFERLEDGTIVDAQNRTWQMTEAALLGSNEEMLERRSGHISFWFGWQSFFPTTEVYSTDSE